MKSQSRIEQLKRDNLLSDFIKGNGITELENRGTEFWGCCPLHNERTPSFAIKKKGEYEIWYCQGCGRGGDIIKFIQLYYNCGVKEAIKKLGGGKEVQNEVPEQPEPEWGTNFEKFKQSFPSGDIGQVAKEKKVISIDKWRDFEKALSQNQKALDWL